MCKKLKIIIGTLLVTTLVNVNVFAAPIAHLWSDDNLTQSYNRPYYIGNALSGAGLNVSKFVDKTFTKTTFLSKVATPHVLYFNGHGGNNGSNTFLAPPGGGYVYPSDIKSKASINSKDVENLSLNILEEFDLKGLEIKENNLKIVNEVSDNFEWNPNTKLAYIIEFDYLLNDFISHGYLTLDANTGELLDLVY